MGHDTSQIARRCERAVITAYRDLRQLGSDDMAAFQACTALYRIHHPEASLNEARRLVAEWIDHHVVRADRWPDGWLRLSRGWFGPPQAGARVWRCGRRRLRCISR